MVQLLATRLMPVGAVSLLKTLKGHSQMTKATIEENMTALITAIDQNDDEIGKKAILNLGTEVLLDIRRIADAIELLAARN